MSTGHWVGYTPRLIDTLPDDERQELERRMRARREKRGDLLAVVEVRVYEGEAHPQVSFPEHGLLRPDSDLSVISQVVARARDALGNWH